MRSASSLAFFSAASKSMPSEPTIFFAPSFCVFLDPKTFAFLGPVAVVVLRSAADEVVLLLVSVPARGDLDRVPFPFCPAFRNGEGVRPTTGGVAVREGGGVGRFIDGLSHEEKKSPSGSPAGVEAPSVE